jgi:gamma-glutamyltranspeptidase/glutathione hydrolase/leukotriene-C4 hydrolase
MKPRPGLIVFQLTGSFVEHLLSRAMAGTQSSLLPSHGTGLKRCLFGFLTPKLPSFAPCALHAARRRLQRAPVTTAILHFLLALVAAASAAAPAGRREVVTSPHGAVAADDGRCSRIGRDALRQGGTAVDASVATALCLGVVSAASSGVGGGAFMLVRLADGSAVVYDSRETAPLAASKVSRRQSPSLCSLFAAGIRERLAP